jgi:hypothetical protein
LQRPPIDEEDDTDDDEDNDNYPNDTPQCHINDGPPPPFLIHPKTPLIPNSGNDDGNNTAATADVDPLR